MMPLRSHFWGSVRPAPASAPKSHSNSAALRCSRMLFAKRWNPPLTAPIRLLKNFMGSLRMSENVAPIRRKMLMIRWPAPPASAIAPSKMNSSIFFPTATAKDPILLTIGPKMARARSNTPPKLSKSAAPRVERKRSMAPRIKDHVMFSFSSSPVTQEKALFSLSLALLPLFLFLRGARGAGVLRWLADLLLSRPGLIFLPGGLMALTETIFRGGWPGYYNLVDDWANVTLFAQCMFWGFVLVSDPRLIEAIRRQWRAAMAVAVAITTVMLWVVWTTGTRPQPGYSDPLYGLYTITLGVNTWCWLIGWLGLGYTYLNRPGVWLDRASEISYPFYILHHTILIGIGFYVIQTPLGVWPKFLIIGVASLIVTLLTCWLARLTPLTRFVVGMKPRR